VGIVMGSTVRRRATDSYFGQWLRLFRDNRVAFRRSIDRNDTRQPSLSTDLSTALEAVESHKFVDKIVVNIPVDFGIHVVMDRYTTATTQLIRY
jgi:hypothetical protein